MVPVAIHFNGNVTNADKCCLIEASVQQINVLNQDFASLNPDISLYQSLSSHCSDEFPPSALSPGAAIQFFIATSNHPQGSGLMEGEYAITVGQEEFCDAGSEWAGYLNIFVDDDWGQPDNIAGEASGIGDAENPDGNGGIAVIPSVFGAPGVNCSSGTELNSSLYQNLGRTVTHEVGHYFGLKHIFNDIGGTCVDNDDIADTPKQSLENTGSPTVTLSTCISSAGRSCGQWPLNEFYMNYMDYTDDIVKVMFTAGQASLMEGYANMGSWKNGTNNSTICSIFSAPVLTSTNIIVDCPSTSFDLTSLNVSSFVPCNSIIKWSTDNNASNGLSNIILSPVIQTGVYYAYYYNTLTNCYGPGQQVHLTFNCCEEPDLQINNNSYINSHQYFGGNIIVNSGKILRVISTDLLFNEGKGIIVKDGGRLILEGTTINVCTQGLSWAGLKIESGGIFEAENSTFKNVKDGVVAQTNSTLQINQLDLSGKGKTSGTGIKLEGNVNINFIYYLNINSFNKGIDAVNGSNLYEINHGTITNTQYGIHSTGSPFIINDYIIKYSNESINLIQAPESMIIGSEIRVFDKGINISMSPSTKIDNCIISYSDLLNGIAYDNFFPAITINLSNNCVVQNNNEINSATNAVSVWASTGVEIVNNFITTISTTDGNIVGGPVNLSFGGNHRVNNNVIKGYNSEFGIGSTWNGGTEIINNNIITNSIHKLYELSAIKATGNLDEKINQNMVQGLPQTGIIVQNTMGNHYTCNEVYSQDNQAQDILSNSEQQFLKANTYIGGLYDLKIQSEIGIQVTFDEAGNLSENNGNLFIGGNTLAEGLNQEQLFNSRFFVNPNIEYHMPSNPISDGEWFITNSVSSYVNCEGLLIGSNFILGNDPNKICSYWAYLKSIRTTKPELFFVKLVHLLKYSKTKAGFLLPNCVKQDPVFTALCGVTQIVDVSVALAKLSENSTNSNAIQFLQTQYKAETSNAGKTAISRQIAQLMVGLGAQYDSDRFADSLKLDSLSTKLNTINCTSTIVNKWKEILKIYINFIKNGSVAQADKSALESYSTDCSDLNGEAIHLARAMVNTYNKSYYDIYDGCLHESTPRHTLPSDEVIVAISPNPTSGKIGFTFGKEFSGVVSIWNLNGQKLWDNKISSSITAEADISNEPAGLYLVKVQSDQGVSKDLKIIMIK